MRRCRGGCTRGCLCVYRPVTALLNAERLEIAAKRCAVNGPGYANSVRAIVRFTVIVFFNVCRVQWPKGDRVDVLQTRPYLTQLLQCIDTNPHVHDTVMVRRIVDAEDPAEATAE